LPLAISVARCTTARASTASYTRAQNSKAPTKAVVCAYPSTKRCACRSRPAPLRNVPNFRSSRYRFVMAMMATTIFAAITEHSVQKMMWYILFPLSADTPFAKLRLDLCGSRGGRGRGRQGFLDCSERWSAGSYVRRVSSRRSRRPPHSRPPRWPLPSRPCSNALEHARLVGRGEAPYFVFDDAVFDAASR
jgi:hypothetical protein